MPMAKLISYVDTPEAVSAAVQSGADEIYVTIAVPPVAGVSPGDFAGAARFCRVRGVKIYAMLDFFPKSDALGEALNAAVEAWKAGADGVVASDPGLILALRRSLPDASIFGGRLLNVHSSGCMLVASAMGLHRISIASEVGREDIKSMLSAAMVETEVIVHGPMKPGFEGLNLLAAVSGLGSERRGTSSRALYGDFTAGARAAKPFVMPDICLFSHISELMSLGVGCISVDCRGRRPEYAAMLTGIYRRAVSGVAPAEGEFELLDKIEPAVGLFDGYYTGRFNISAPTDIPAKSEDPQLLNEVRKSYLRREFQRVPVYFTASVELGGPLKLTAEDDLGNSAYIETGSAVPAFSEDFTQVALQTELYKTGGTPFLCSGVKCAIQRGTYLHQSIIAEARDRLLEELMVKREEAPARHGAAVLPKERGDKLTEPPLLTVSVQSRAQLTARLLELAPPVIYFPLEKLKGSASAISPFVEKEGISVCVSLPAVIFDSERAEIAEMLKYARSLGINEALAASFGQALGLKKLGFTVRGDFTIGADSEASLMALSSLHFASVALSPELTSEEISAMQKLSPAELIVYGRLPVVQSAVPFARYVTGVEGNELTIGIEDENGYPMPVIPAFGGRNTVYSGKKLYLATREHEYIASGLWGVRLSFTTESPDKVDAVCERYLDLGRNDPPVYWRGLY